MPPNLTSSMDYLESFLLGLIQGLTEFLPISSSGHLALTSYLFNAEFNQGITFEVIVHFGTLCSIFIFFKKEIAELLGAAFTILKNPLALPARMESDYYTRLIVYILLSMIPALIVGFTLKDQIEHIFDNPVLVSGMLITTGFILFFTRSRGEGGTPLTMGKAFIIGLAQAFAILPGISRSGSTIAAGLYLNGTKTEIANFSFLMVIPVIAGATLLQIKDLLEVGIENVPYIHLLIGFLASFISGYYALKFLIHLIRKRGIHLFAYYCWTIGAIGLIYFLLLG